MYYRVTFTEVVDYAATEVGGLVSPAETYVSPVYTCAEYAGDKLSEAGLFCPSVDTECRFYFTQDGLDVFLPVLEAVGDAYNVEPCAGSAVDKYLSVEVEAYDASVEGAVVYSDPFQVAFAV